MTNSMGYATHRLDVTRFILRLLSASLLAAAIAGCASTPKRMGLPWWPQGPGNTPEDAVRTDNATVSKVGEASASAEGSRPLAQKPLNTGEPIQTAMHTETAHSVPTPPVAGDTQAVRYGDLLFVSGQIANDPVSLAIVGSDIESQVRTAMDNVTRILESHGLAISNILSVTLYLQDIAELAKADAVYASYFRRSLPARSVVRVDGLPKGSLVEIAVIAGK